MPPAGRIRDGIDDGSSADEFESELGWAVSIVAAAYRKLGAGAVAELPGGPRGYLILAAVAHDHSRSQLALAKRLGVDKTVLTYLIDDLESAGLVQRRPDPADRRARQLTITDAGTKTLRQARRRLGTAEKQLLAPLNAVEGKRFRQLLERIAQAAQHREGGAVAVCE